MTSPYAVKIPSMRSAPPADPKRKEAEGRADLLRLLGSAAPIAGTAIGGIAGGLLGAGAGGVGAIPGAAAGAGIGGGIGQGLAGLAGAGADQQTREFEEDDAEKNARRQLQMQILASARR